MPPTAAAPAASRAASSTWRWPLRACEGRSRLRGDTGRLHPVRPLRLGGRRCGGALGAADPDDDQGGSRQGDVGRAAAVKAVIAALGPYGYIVAMQAALQGAGKLPATLPAPLREGPK